MAASDGIITNDKHIQGNNVPLFPYSLSFPLASRFFPSALDKLLDHPVPHKSRVSSAYDLASLILFGTSAVPVRLKVLLDALFLTFSEVEVNQLLHKLGWSEADFARGYIQKVSQRHTYTQRKHTATD